ncbi:hypothetical protein HELRODRAFT_168099 [Helobdella robusta]|uniref:Uncharacterized protein n=1 Tax=Helobdella robusta TaxID=6412 RepID=T1F060_HELRO|nr:hypothetical protein HELRODRAFT_168099 [Helobdella robusta]ESO10216.1 hypothetical protein HELRODRAFT_168099 [Helobdella robusta]
MESKEKELSNKKNFFLEMLVPSKKSKIQSTRHLSIDCSEVLNSDLQKLKVFNPSSDDKKNDANNSKDKFMTKISATLSKRRYSLQQKNELSKISLRTSLFSKGHNDENVNSENKLKKCGWLEKIGDKKNMKETLYDPDRENWSSKSLLNEHNAIDGPLIYPATPELVLEHHRKKPFLTSNEEWVLVVLNKYECLVDSFDIVTIIAKHSIFFEVDPEELWEEFFAFVSNVPSYDEIINEDVWQEFKDKKYMR